MISAIKSRLPQGKEILPVYAVIVFFLLGWATLAFFWKFPAWLNYLTLGEVVVLYLYAAFTEFLESLVYLFFLLLLCTLLPSKLLKDNFPVRGTLAAVALPGLILLTDYLIMFREFAAWQAALAALVIVCVLVMLLIWLSGKYRAVEKGLLAFGDRTILFLYLYIPLMIVSSVVVLARMLVI
jgi:hypothetical protein